MSGTRDARQRILDAAGDLVTAGGLGAATPAAIAERAGAGKMSLYRHFSGKDELVAEALAERDPAYPVLLLGGPKPPPAPERLPALVCPPRGRSRSSRAKIAHRRSTANAIRSGASPCSSLTTAAPFSSRPPSAYTWRTCIPRQA